MVKKTKKKKKTQKKKLTAQEQAKKQEKTQQTKEIRRLLKNIGFSKVPGISGKHFNYDGRTSEIDEAFHYENVLLLIERTTTNPPGNHLKNKKLIYDKINASHAGFIDFLLKEETFDKFSEYHQNSSLKSYTSNQMQVKIVYCSRHPIDEEHKNQLQNVCFFDYPILKYFDSIGGIIKKSSRYEFFNFLGINYDDIGENILQGGKGSNIKFSGHILPENIAGIQGDTKSSLSTLMLVHYYSMHMCLEKRAGKMISRPAYIRE